MSYRRIGKMVWGAAMICAIFLIALSAAFGHDEFRCSSDSYRNAMGMDCCSAKTDCTTIPNETAYTARVGGEVEASFQSWQAAPAETKSVIVTAIHPSCDDHGWSWMCRTGCLFRVAGF